MPVPRQVDGPTFRCDPHATSCAVDDPTQPRRRAPGPRQPRRRMPAEAASTTRVATSTWLLRNLPRVLPGRYACRAATAPANEGTLVTECGLYRCSAMIGAS